VNVKTARQIAKDWVRLHAGQEPSFRGAYFSGSIVDWPDDAEMPTGSDIDIMVVINQDEAPPKLGKFIYKGILLEVTYISPSQLASAKEVLSSYHLAGGFRTNTIIADPAGILGELQANVSRHFAELAWVRRRCENAREKIVNGLRSIDRSAPFHDRVTSWLFPTGITTHILLVAALRNPTVRLRYVRARSVLTDYGLEDHYPALLELLGCDRLTPGRVKHHVDELARTFDAASAIARTPFNFSSDITPAARTIAIDGSYELIKAGLHREAMFWIVATFARCHKILASDAAPDLGQSLAPAFYDAVGDLGITSPGDLIRRAENVARFLPRLWDIAEAIMLANPDITGK